MELTITAKIKLYPTKEQIEKIEQTYAQIMLGLNYISKYSFGNNTTVQKKLHNALYYTLRDKFNLKSQMAESCIKTVIAKYKSAKENGHKRTLIEFKNKEYDLVFNRDYSLNKNLFSINTIGGRLKIPYETLVTEKYFDGTYKFGTAKLVNKYGKYFLHIPVTKDYPEVNHTSIDKIVGIDLGLNFIATIYDSYGKVTFYNGGKIKQYRGHLKALRKELQQKGTPSARRKIKQIGSRENRYVSDINHQITKTLVDKYGPNTLFVLEDLTGIRNATEKVRIKNRYVSVSWAFYQFRQFLEYKAILNQCLVIAVDPKYTSQTCPKCGHIERANRDKKNHIFKCKNCNYTSNDDRIGSMNLWRKGLEYIETNSKDIQE